MSRTRLFVCRSTSTYRYNEYNTTCAGLVILSHNTRHHSQTISDTEDNNNNNYYYYYSLCVCVCVRVLLPSHYSNVFLSRSRYTRNITVYITNMCASTQVYRPIEIPFPGASGIGVMHPSTVATHCMVDGSQYCPHSHWYPW